MLTAIRRASCGGLIDTIFSTSQSSLRASTGARVDGKHRDGCPCFYPNDILILGTLNWAMRGGHRCGGTATRLQQLRARNGGFSTWGNLKLELLVKKKGYERTSPNSANTKGSKACSKSPCSETNVARRPQTSSSKTGGIFVLYVRLRRARKSALYANFED